VEDWAEVHRLFHRERLAKAAIARRLGMSRNTVDQLLALAEPSRYVRARAGSLLDRSRAGSRPSSTPTRAHLPPSSASACGPTGTGAV